MYKSILLDKFHGQKLDDSQIKEIKGGAAFQNQSFFATPKIASCSAEIFDDGFESGDSSQWSKKNWSIPAVFCKPKRLLTNLTASFFIPSGHIFIAMRCAI